MTIEQAKESIGASVKYIPAPYSDTIVPSDFGIITSVNDSFVFVRYDKDIHSKATKPKDLRFVKEPR